VDIEFPNLRAAFRWAAGNASLAIATTIASHAALLALLVLRYEPAGWAEELLEAAASAAVDQLPRLYLAASLCMFTGRPDAGVGDAQIAEKLEGEPGYSGFPPTFSGFWEVTGLLYAGRIERAMEVCADLAADTQPGSGRMGGQAVWVWLLGLAGRPVEAAVIAEETLAAARSYGNPLWVAIALLGYGTAFAETNPHRALDAYREQLEYCRGHRIVYMEAVSIRDLAWLEALHGNLRHAFELFDSAFDMFQRAGDYPAVSMTLGELVVCFDHVNQFVIAATLYGAEARYGRVPVPGLPDVVEHLRTELGTPGFDDCIAAGAAMELADAVRYARRQIRLANQTLEVT
jgi:tetratricopeptide (TPR) repeat protein